MNLDRIPLSYALVGVAAVGLGLYVVAKGSVSNAASSIGAGVVNAAAGVVSGAASAVDTVATTAVGGAGAVVGLPTPADTTTDPRVARWIADNVGWMAASRWASASALAGAFSVPVGGGTAPPPGSKIALAYPNAANYDETQRLLNRYPAPASSDPPAVDIFDPSTWGLGS